MCQIEEYIPQSYLITRSPALIIIITNPVISIKANNRVIIIILSQCIYIQVTNAARVCDQVEEERRK